MARTIEGKVRPFGTGTKGLVVRVAYPETPDEIEEVLASRYEGDPVEGLMKDAARKSLIRIQDHVRDHEQWEGREAPDEEDTAAWMDIQDEVESLADGAVLDLGTWPGERKSDKPDELQQAMQDPEAAEDVIARLRERHGL